MLALDQDEALPLSLATAPSAHLPCLQMRLLRHNDGNAKACRNVPGMCMTFHDACMLDFNRKGHNCKLLLQRYILTLSPGGV